MEQYNIGDIAKIYVYYVNRVMEENARKKQRNDQSLFSRYDSQVLSLDDFFKNLFLRMSCCLECYIISLMYIVRINKCVPGIVNDSSIRNLVISSIVLAQKFFDEICYRSDFYASFNQLSVWQINTLEVEFLCRIHFSLAVFPDQYEAFYNELRNLCSVPSLREQSVSIPAIVNIAPSGCPLLKYVFTPQEQQRKEAYYRQCEQQRQSMLHRFPPIPKPILLVPTLPYPLRHTPAAKDAPPHTRSTEFYYPPPTVCPPPLVPPLPPVANVVSNPASVVARPPVFG